MCLSFQLTQVDQKLLDEAGSEVVVDHLALALDVVNLPLMVLGSPC